MKLRTNGFNEYVKESQAPSNQGEKVGIPFSYNICYSVVPYACNPRVKIDPLPLWTKMKGQNVSDNNAALLEGCNLVKDDEVSNNNCNGRGKMDADNESANCRSFTGENKADSGQLASSFRYKRIYHGTNLRCLCHGTLYPSHGETQKYEDSARVIFDEMS